MIPFMAQRDSTTEHGGLGTALGRGLTKRCARCGGRGIFDSYFKMKDNCPTCGYRFERESGYWVGAIVINTAAAMALFFFLFIAVVLATMPGIEWIPLLLVTAGTMAAFPVLFFPFSKTIWMAIDLHFHKYRDEEQQAEGSHG